MQQGKASSFCEDSMVAPKEAAFILATVAFFNDFTPMKTNFTRQHTDVMRPVIDFDKFL